jgi:hypothetical protein
MAETQAPRSSSAAARRAPRERLAFWKRKMPDRSDLTALPGGIAHPEEQLHDPVLDCLGPLDLEVARADGRDTEAFAPGRARRSAADEYTPAVAAAAAPPRFPEIAA